MTSTATPRTPVPLTEKVALTALEVEALTGISASKVRRLTRDGLLARVPHTGAIVIARAELDRFLTAGVQ